MMKMDRAVLSGVLFAANVLISSVVFAGNPIITYTQQHELLSAVEGIPSVTVMDDGQVEVFRPSFMHEAGTFTFVLNAQDLATLITVANAAHDSGFSTVSIQAGIDNVKTDDGTLFEVSDSTQTTIVLTLGSESGKISSNSKPDATRLPVELSINDIAQLSERYPAVISLSTLRTLEDSLRALFERPVVNLGNNN